MSAAATLAECLAEVQATTNGARFEITEQYQQAEIILAIKIKALASLSPPAPPQQPPNITFNAPVHDGVNINIAAAAATT